MDPKYLIGVPEMDKQHELLLDLVERVKAVENDEFSMNAVVLEMISYANAHLDEEEAFLKRNGLGDFEKEHSKKHVLFREQAMEFYDAFRAAETIEAKGDLLRRIGSFCESWLLQHIHVEDRHYAELLKRIRVS